MRGRKFLFGNLFKPSIIEAMIMQVIADYLAKPKYAPKRTKKPWRYPNAKVSKEFIDCMQFEVICSAAGINVGYMRKMIERLKEKG